MKKMVLVILCLVPHIIGAMTASRSLDTGSDDIRARVRLTDNDKENKRPRISSATPSFPMPYLPTSPVFERSSSILNEYTLDQLIDERGLEEVAHDMKVQAELYNRQLGIVNLALQSQLDPKQKEALLKKRIDFQRELNFHQQMYEMIEHKKRELENRAAIARLEEADRNLEDEIRRNLGKLEYNPAKALFINTMAKKESSRNRQFLRGLMRPISNAEFYPMPPVTQAEDN